MSGLLEKRSAILFGVLVATYLVAVAVVIAMRTAPFIGSETDGVYYMIAARSLFTNAFIPPTYGGGIGMPLAIAAANLFVADTFRSAQLVSALAGLIYLVAAVRVGARLFSDPVGLAAGALLLVSPILLVNSTSSLTDVLSACLPLAGLWLLLPQETGRSWFKTFFGGMLFGAAFSVRSVNFVFFPLPIALSAGGEARKNVKQISVAALGILIGALPQLYVNQKYFGNAFYSENWRNTAALVFDWDYVNKLSSFGEVIRQAGLRLVFVWIDRLLTDLPVALYNVMYLPLLFSIPGILLAVGKQSRHRKLLLTWSGCTFAYLALIAAVWRVEARYFLPVLPLLFFAAVLMWKEMTSSSRRIFISGVSVAILMSAVVTVRDTRRFLTAQSTEFKEAGLFLRDRASHDDMILASQPSAFFYAHRPGILFEALSNDVHRLDAEIVSRNIQWIVFDERRGYRDNPSFVWMLQPDSSEGSQRGWKAVFVLESPRIVVWQTRPTQQTAATGF